MKALILAAGYGTRLRPITDKTPKCLVEINGEPLLKRWLDCLVEAGLSDIYINTHHLAEKIDNFFSTLSAPKVTIVYENELLGTAGTLLHNLDYFLGDDLLMLHADNYCQESLLGLIQAHMDRPKECVMTMMLFKADNPQECGIVELDYKNIVQKFYEKKLNPPSNLANGAVYILSKDMLSSLKENVGFVSDFSKQVIEKYLGRIYTYETKMMYVDIGTVSKYQSLLRHLKHAN